MTYAPLRDFDNDALKATNDLMTAAPLNTDPATLWASCAQKIQPNLGLARPTLGIPLREELYNLLVEFAHDLASPEGYGHDVPAEVIRRASRILKLTEAERRHQVPGAEPPPARCEKCENE